MKGNNINQTHQTQLTYVQLQRGSSYKRDGQIGWRSYSLHLEGTFNADIKIDPGEHNKEFIFRHIYIFEKVYRKDKLHFMNNATLRDFD